MKDEERAGHRGGRSRRTVIKKKRPGGWVGALRGRVEEAGARILDGVVDRLAGSDDAPESAKPATPRPPRTASLTPEPTIPEVTLASPKEAPGRDPDEDLAARNHPPAPDDADPAPAEAAPASVDAAPAPVDAEATIPDDADTLRPTDQAIPDPQKPPRAATARSEVRFGIDRVVVLPRSGRRLFAYWELPADRLAGARQATLRLLHGPDTIREVEVDPRQGHQYFEDVGSGPYRAALVVDAQILSMSTQVDIPS